MITEMLKPLEDLVRKACYVSMQSRGVGQIAKKLVERGKPIMVRYLRKIEDLHDWVRTFDPLPWRFEPHLDGRGIRKLMRSKEPEKILWKHAKFIRDNWEKIVDNDSHRKYMQFDSDSRILEISDWPQIEIDMHYK